MTITRRKFFKQSLAAGAFLTASMSPTLSHAAKKKAKQIRTAKRVLIISFDGICIEGFKKAYTPNIDAMMKRGAASLATRDVMPSVTLPNYSSIMLGAGPEVHGVSDNSWKVDNYKIPAVVRDEDGYFPSIFQVLKENVPDMKTAFFWNWKPLILPYNQKYFDETSFGENDEYIPNYGKALEFLKENRDNHAFVFLYSVHTDHAGHKYSWMSPEYIKALEEGDVQIGILIEKLKQEGLFEDTHIMFLSDHGGIGKGHGGVSEVEMTVPWIISGPGIKKGFTIEEPNNTVNTASTVAKLFGVEQPLCWTGEVPMSIFE